MRFAKYSSDGTSGSFSSSCSIRVSWWAIISILILIGCEKKIDSPSGLPMAKMEVGSKTFTLEIAADEPSRSHGLMERDDLDSDHGMIFLFAVPDEQAFYMHHTRFPLDIIFADANGKVVSVSTMKAYDESNTYSHGRVKYAIELNAGRAKAAGVKAGDQLRIPPAILKSEIR